MDPIINPSVMRYRSFGQVDRFVQEGEGLVSGFINIFKRLAPFLKSAFNKVTPIVQTLAKNKVVQSTAGELANKALETGVNLTKSAISGENVSAGLKKDLADAGKIGLQGLKKLASPENTQKKKKKTTLKRSAPTTYEIKTKKKKNKTRKDLFT